MLLPQSIILWSDCFYKADHNLSPWSRIREDLGQRIHKLSTTNNLLSLSNLFSPFPHKRLPVLLLRYMADTQRSDDTNTQQRSDWQLGAPQSGDFIKISSTRMKHTSMSSNKQTLAPQWLKLNGPQKVFSTTLHVFYFQSIYCVRRGFLDDI